LQARARDVRHYDEDAVGMRTTRPRPSREDVEVVAPDVVRHAIAEGDLEPLKRWRCMGQQPLRDLTAEFIIAQGRGVLRHLEHQQQNENDDPEGQRNGVVLLDPPLRQQYDFRDVEHGHEQEHDPPRGRDPRQQQPRRMARTAGVHGSAGGPRRRLRALIRLASRRCGPHGSGL